MNDLGVIQHVRLYQHQRAWDARYDHRAGYVCRCGHELGFNPRVGEHCKCGAKIEEVIRTTAREARGAR